MMRLVATTCLAVSALGCGTGREIRPGPPGYGPVGEAPLPALHDQINGEQGGPGRVELVPPATAPRAARDQAAAPPPISPPASAMAAAPPDSVPALPWPVEEMATATATATAPAPQPTAPPSQAAPLDAPAPPPVAFEAAPALVDPGLMRASASMPAEHDGPPGLAPAGPGPAVASFGSIPAPPPAGPAPPPFPPPAETPPAVAAQGPQADVEVDPAVRPASATGAPDRMAALSGTTPGKPIGEWAARVNEDIITWNELQTAVRDRLREVPAEEAQDPRVRELIVVSTLDNLIDQTLILQHARRNELKNEKAWEQVNKDATKFWEQDQQPALLKKYQAKDGYELERKLIEANKSLHDIQESFRHEFIARHYLMNKVFPKIHVDLPEIRSYYHENRGHEQFYRPEQITWREVVVEVRNHPDRASARAKADAALARIRRGDDFARVAAELSEGPNARQGGLWDKSSPGSYAVPAVNQALASLAPGQPSPVLEGPDSYHIVRVEEHTQAGILPFAEVQTKIREILWSKKQDKAMEDYLKLLYRGAVITTVFPEYLPRDRRGPKP